jgi:hypothetical protein
MTTGGNLVLTDAHGEELPRMTLSFDDKKILSEGLRVELGIGRCRLLIFLIHSSSFTYFHGPKTTWVTQVDGHGHY